MSDVEATVLVVDDNRAVADTYAAFLDERYAVRTAYGGEAALETLDASVDVVLLDRRMPDRSGDEVLAEINSRALDPRVVMLTAVDPDFDIVDMPFDAYVVKPVERADVTHVVAEMVARAGYDDEFRRFLSLASSTPRTSRGSSAGGSRTSLPGPPRRPRASDGRTTGSRSASDRFSLPPDPSGSTAAGALLCRYP
ncbi:DNA-binding protein [Halobacteriales archaeon QH_1_68_42]|nr:MAG: DNA-binding protein [Halobacteriales archaeon QH_1_68_42]